MKKFKHGDLICGIFPKSISRINYDKWFWTHDGYPEGNCSNRKYPYKTAFRLWNKYLSISGTRLICYETYNEIYYEAMADCMQNVHLATKREIKELNNAGYEHIGDVIQAIPKIKNKIIMKEIKIKVPEGYEIDKKESTFEKIIFKKKEKIFPKTWEELRRISGFYIEGNSEINKATDFYCSKNHNENVFRTITQAKSALAKAQLSQLIYVYNNGWEPDWVRDDTKHTITRYKNRINSSWEVHDSRLLAFKTEETRNKFLENFRPLIEQYLMIE